MLQPAARFNVFHGDNGQGKTNLLESIYVVGALRSFRTQRMADLIGFGREQAYIGARIQRGGLERVYELSQRGSGRLVRLDGKAVRPISRYFGDFNVVLFAPEDLQVPRGSPADRRRFLDRAVFNRAPRYLGDVQAYEKVVKNRNALLREIGSGKRSLRQAGDLLAVFDQKLAEVGARLAVSRMRFLDEIRPRFRAAFESITQTGLEVDVIYTASTPLPPAPALSGNVGETVARNVAVDVAAALAACLAEQRLRDVARGTTSVGPHRDDLVFRLDGHAAASFASQGQLRALVLAWKTAEMELLAETHGEEPVLLLDDVSSELDATRNEYLFEFLKRRPTQCFITTTHPRHVLLSSERVDYRVQGGVVTRQTP
jgi:DNA replication and repair protein RecF